MLKHIGTQKLETERLILRKFKEEDAVDMFENWASDSEVTKYLTWAAHSTVEVSKQITDLWVSGYSNTEHYQWAIELKDIGEVIGSIGLVDLDNNNENCEIGYCMGKAFWGKGIMTEAFSELISFLFKEIGFERIGARHDVDNPASGHVMEKCGLKYEGTLRKSCRDNKGNLVDCKYYSILKDEFLNYHKDYH